MRAIEEMLERSTSAATTAAMTVPEPEIDSASTSSSKGLKSPKLSLPTFNGKYT